MARYDALSRAGEQADRMTAASLPYIREAAGANAVPSAMNAAGAMQDMVLRQAEHEVRLQDIQLRHQLLGQEIMLRQQLAPLQVAEAQAQLESMRIQQQIRDLQYNEAQYAAAQPRPAIGSPETGWKVYRGRQLVDADPENPLDAYSIDLATSSRRAQEMELEGQQADILKTRSEALRNVREPGAAVDNAMVGLQRNAANMADMYKSQLSAVTDDDDYMERYGESRQEALAKLREWTAEAESYRTRRSGNEPVISPDMAATIASQLGTSPEQAVESVSAVAAVYGKDPQVIVDRLFIGGPEADKIRKLIDIVSKVRGQR